MALDLDPGDPLVAFGAFTLLVFVGFLGNLAFAYLRINDALLLMALGVLIGPVAGWIEPASLGPLASVAGPLALVLITLDGGLALKMKDLVQGVGGAFAMAILGFGLTVGLVATALIALDGTPTFSALAFGAVVGGTSSVIVLSSLAYIRCEKRTETVLALESSLTDIFVVVGVFALAAAGGAAALSGSSGGLHLGGMAGQMGILFGMSLLLGALVGVGWLILVPSVRDHPFGYMLTLGAAFFLYILAEIVVSDASVAATGQGISGAGPLAILAFGLVLGNASAMGPWLRRRTGEAFGKGLKRFQGEIAFVVRTFFFIQLGIVVDPGLLDDPGILAVGAILFLVQAWARYLAVATVRRTPRLDHDGWVMFAMMPRGLACAVMASVPLAFGMPGAEDFVAYAFIMVGLTNIASTVGGFVLGDRRVERKPPEAFVPNRGALIATHQPTKPRRQAGWVAGSPARLATARKGDPFRLDDVR